jgi:hypothetical protein
MAALLDPTVSAGPLASGGETDRHRGDRRESVQAVVQDGLTSSKSRTHWARAVSGTTKSISTSSPAADLGRTHE